MRPLLAEAIGTFCLVFAGTGAIIVDQTTGGGIGHVGIALTFGLVVMAMVCALGDVSGAHLNPAVSIAFALSGRSSALDTGRYILAQLAGAFAAVLLHRLLFPDHATLGATVPAGPPWQSFVLEVVLTFMLMLVILSVASGPKEKGLVAGLAIGGVVGLEALFAGPISGASMNPARSLAPAVVSGHLEPLWIYLVAPVLGAAIAVPFGRILFPATANDQT
jgi:aquaporin NIP